MSWINLRFFDFFWEIVHLVILPTFTIISFSVQYILVSCYSYTNNVDEIMVLLECKIGSTSVVITINLS